MNDAACEQQASPRELELKEIFEKSSMAQKLIMKALAGLTVVMGSNLDRSVKFDAMKATVDMIITGAELHAFKTLQKGNRDTEAPLDVLLSILGLSAIDDFEKRERRFNTMMQLFVEEMEKRGPHDDAH
jgi:hypothetical protein